MGDILSQEEINALLSNSSDTMSSFLTKEKEDIIGEFGNISLGTSATTLSTLLNQRVEISTPKVTTKKISEIADKYARPCICVKVDYKEGLRGSNYLVLKQDDVKIITDLMMGGSGDLDEDEEINELHLSAISEAMNQMIGSSATSIASMLKKKVDIGTPNAFLLISTEDSIAEKMGMNDEEVICTSFRMVIGNLVDSEITQIISLDFAKEMVQKLTEIANNESSTNQGVQEQPNLNTQATSINNEGNVSQLSYGQTGGVGMYQGNANSGNVNVQPVQFQNFDMSSVSQQKENIGIIRDVPLEITVELGRTKKLIKEILEFNPGTIIELDKLAGEPIDILVNGKFVAKGEVVVIDDNFGIRITDIISVENRI